MISKQEFLYPDAGFATRAIHEAQSPSQWKSRAVVPPISITSTFELEDFDLSKGYVYGRWGNPSRDVLEKVLASLDNAKYGLCYPSGLSALSAVVQLLKAGDHLLCSGEIYGGCRHQLAAIATKNGIEIDFFDVEDDLLKLFKTNTKLVWVESASNPLSRLADIRALAKACRTRDDIIFAVDNTFLTPYFMKPLDLGAHLVMYSVTKYLNGHSDVIMGAITVKDDDLHERLRFLQNYLGTIPSPFDCFLVSRGLKTLAVRMRQHASNGLAVAKYLQTHPLIEKVTYTGLPDHPQHALLQQQCTGFSGMLGFYVKGGGLKEALKFLQSTKFIRNAGSLGGVESLALSPPALSHFKIPVVERLKMGITDNLIRLSVGLEEVEDLCKDIDQALKKALAK